MARLRTLRDDGGTGEAELPYGAGPFVALVDGDVPASEKLSEALHRLCPAPVGAAPEELERLTAGDLVAALAPRGSATCATPPTQKTPPACAPLAAASPPTSGSTRSPASR